MLCPSKPASIYRLIPEGSATTFIDKPLYQRAMFELDPDWARAVHPLLDCEIAEAICFVWQTVEGWLWAHHAMTGVLEGLTIHADGAIAVEIKYHQHFDAVMVQNVFGIPFECRRPS
jgi:hypothetical protein